MKKNKKTNITRQLVQYMLDNRDKSIEIKEFANNLLLETQRDHISDPGVYLCVGTRLGYPERKYLWAKTKFPVELNKYKWIRVYIGTLTEYPLGSKDKSAKILGKQLLIEKLKEKYDR